MIMVSCRPSRGPKKIKTAIWVGEKQWQALKALADSLDRTAAQLVLVPLSRIYLGAGTQEHGVRHGTAFLPP